MFHKLVAKIEKLSSPLLNKKTLFFQIGCKLRQLTWGEVV